MPRFPGLPEATSLTDVFQTFPAGIEPLLEYHDVVLRGPSPLTVAQRELVAALVSGLNSCAFCFGSHAAVAESFGVPADLFTDLLDNIETAPIEGKMKPLLAYVKKLTVAPARVTDGDAQAVFAVGWSEHALHDTVTVCALFNLMNRIVEGHGVMINDSIRNAQRAQMEQNRGKPPSATAYRDYGRRIGLYPGNMGEETKTGHSS